MKFKLLILAAMLLGPSTYGSKFKCYEKQNHLKDGEISYYMAQVKFTRVYRHFSDYLSKFGIFIDQSERPRFPKTAAELNMAIRKYNLTVPLKDNIATNFYPDDSEEGPSDKTLVERFAFDQEIPIHSLIRSKRDYDLFMHALEHLALPREVVVRAAYNMRMLIRLTEDRSLKMPQRFKNLIYGEMSSRIQAIVSVFEISGLKDYTYTRIGSDHPEDFTLNPRAPLALKNAWNALIPDADTINMIFYIVGTKDLREGLSAEIGLRLQLIASRVKSKLSDSEAQEAFSALMAKIANR